MPGMNAIPRFSRACLLAGLLAGMTGLAAIPAAANHLDPAKVVAVGKPLPDFVMRGVRGPAKKLSAYRGKPLIINVWASWCAPCRAEMGSLDRLNKRFSKHFNMVGISTDSQIERAEKFVDFAKTSFPHFIDTQYQLEEVLGADRIPLTLLVDSQGKVLARHYGAKEWDSPDAIRVISEAFKIRLN